MNPFENPEQQAGDYTTQPTQSYQPQAHPPQTHYAPPQYPPQPVHHAPVHESAPPPHAPIPATLLPSDDPMRPVPVVKVLSPVGVEYVFLTITLLVGAGALVSAFLSLVNGSAGFAALAFPVATLLVTAPLFAGLFLHLKRLEARNPDLRLDPSKRRSTQVTQIISFLVCLFTLIGFFAAVFASFGGDLGVPVGKAALDALCILVVAGGVLFYYWRDERAGRR